MDVTGLFVYGTLRAGGSNHAWLWRTRPQGAAPAWTPGRLFHLPEAGYPAMVCGPAPTALPPAPGWVRGEYVGYEDAQALQGALEDLDVLEDVAGGLFIRYVRPVLLDRGPILAAWVYTFPEERLEVLNKDNIEIMSGDWSPHLC